MVNEESPLEFYLSERNYSKSHIHSESQGLDKMILILSTGTIVLSINLLFVVDAYFENEYLLFLSLIFLLASIICQIFGYRYSVAKSNQYIEELDSWRRKGFTGPFVPTEKYSECVKLLNNLTAAFVILGVITMVSFAWPNFLKINNKNMEKEKNNKIERVEKHASDLKPREFIITNEESNPKDVDKGGTDGNEKR